MATRYARLGTERANPASRALDRLSPLAIARLMNREDARAVAAVRGALPAVARAVGLIVAALGAGGRLFFVGAGTSGRLGVLEAAECPPTFGTPPGLVQAIMAGGRPAVFRSREGAEDDRAAAVSLVRRRVRAGDVVVGVSASGLTPFVRAALAEAGRRRARTVLVTCNPPAPAGRADRRQAGRGGAGRRRAGLTGPLLIVARPGPEVLAGSTRLKAGTATKLILNTLTTASLARLGRVWGNRMVDLQPRSRKLRQRARRLVAELAGVSPSAAGRALRAAGWRVRVAVVMARTGLSAPAAARALRSAGGGLAAAPRAGERVAVSRGGRRRRRPRPAPVRGPGSRGPSGPRTR